jgi:hypothetical protein
MTRIGGLGTALAVTSNRRTIPSNTDSVLQLLPTANVPSSLVLFTLMLQAKRISETSVPTRSTRRYIPGDGIPYSHRRENFTSYLALTGWALQR